MSVDPATFAVFCLVFFLTWKLFQRKNTANYPPGPFQWPIVGNLLQVAGNDAVCEAFCDYARKYGSICMIKLGAQKVVILGSYDIIKEALIEKASSFSERPLWLYNMREIQNGTGIIAGQNWKNMRRFCLGSLRDFGLGKTSLEEVIRSECQTLVQEIEQHGNKLFNFKKIIHVSVSNIICSIVFGNRFNYDDIEFKTLLEEFEFMLEKVGTRDPVDVLPWLRFLPFIGSSSQAIKAAKQRIDNYIRKRIDEHKLTFDADNIRDIIDLYIVNENSPDESQSMTRADVFQMIWDIFAAGTETTTTTLYWGVLFMALNPEIQKRCVKEIEAIIGRGRPVKLSDRGSLPYTEATLLEVQRLGSIVPDSLPHATTDDVELGGYVIPKHTMIFPSIYSVHRDPTYWTEPELFQPERWLDDNNRLVQHTHFIPFSVGPRMCLGDSLAKMELFLFFTSLLQHGTFTLPPSAPRPGLGAKQGVTRAPHPFMVCYSVAE